MWTIGKIQGAGESPPPLAGNFSGALLVCGTGWSLWKDYKRFLFRESGFDTFAINDAIMHVPDLAHAGSLEHQLLPGWMAVAKHRSRTGAHIHTHAPRVHEPDPAESIWLFQNCLGGTSGLWAVMVGLCLGYERIVLAGVPIDNRGHYFKPDASRHDDGAIRAVWLQAKEEVFDGRVTSLSGWTRELLGHPGEVD